MTVILRWLGIALLTLLAIAALSYIGDFAVFRMRGSPQQKLTVSHFISAPLKGNKQEIDYMGSEDTPCSITLYPQDGMSPCWYLRRHLNQISNYSERMRGGAHLTSARDASHALPPSGGHSIVQSNFWMGGIMFSRTQNENGTLNTRCLYCFMTVAMSVESARELDEVEAHHMCPERALSELGSFTAQHANVLHPR